LNSICSPSALARKAKRGGPKTHLGAREDLSERMNMMAGRMQEQKLALSLNDGLIARALSKKASSARRVSRGVSQRREKKVDTHHRLVHDVLIHGILGEPWTGDDENFELVEIEMTEHGGVDLLVEAGVGLCEGSRLVKRNMGRKERGRRRRRETHLVCTESGRSAFPFPRRRNVDSLPNDGRMIGDDADVGEACSVYRNQSESSSASHLDSLQEHETDPPHRQSHQLRLPSPVR